MKVIKLINLNSEYIKHNLYLNCLGIVLSENKDFAKILFINEQILGDYAILDVNKKDIEEQLTEIPTQYLKLLNINDKINDDNFMQKHSFKIKQFNEGDMVKLITRKEKYIKNDVYKNDIGIVVSNYLVKNEVLVDFTKCDNLGVCSGNCISVNINDLIKI